MLFFLLMVTLPGAEQCLYGTLDKGKTGTIAVTAVKDSLGYHVIYIIPDRTIEVIFDTLNMSTLYVKKTVGKRVDVEARRNDGRYKVNFRGRVFNYRESKPVYDRHALEFTLRGFEYHESFKTTIRLSIPEFMMVNADIQVNGAETVAGPLGEVDCWQVQMAPRIIFFNRKFYFWIEREYPHRFIKMEESSGKNRVWLQEYEKQDLLP